MRVDPMGGVWKSEVQRLQRQHGSYRLGRGTPRDSGGRAQNIQFQLTVNPESIANVHHDHFRRAAIDVASRELEAAAHPTSQEKQK